MRTGGESPGDVTEYVNLWGPTQQDTSQKSPYNVYINKEECNIYVTYQSIWCC